VAELSKDPLHLELEDLVAAHFMSRGCYVETSLKERAPDELLELDIVWTDYREPLEERNPIEVKSLSWGYPDVFKFFGWTRYLGLKPGHFVHKGETGKSPVSLEHVAKRTGIRFVHVPQLTEGVEKHLDELGLPQPAWKGLTELWRFSFAARRRLVKSLNKAVELGVCPESAKAAKNYRHLLNDVVFFIPDIKERVNELFQAHVSHPQLALSAAWECETKAVNFFDPPSSPTFQRALYGGLHYPVQACLYISHRARLYILKALVDYWLAVQRRQIVEVPPPKPPPGTFIIPKPDVLTDAMRAGLAEMSAAKSFRLFPVFWQTFLFSWGGFLLKDKTDQEYADLEKETGVPVDEIPIALSAFDKLFPTQGGWLKDVQGDSRTCLKLMPAAMRGIGAYRRTLQGYVERYEDLRYTDQTTARLQSDHNSTATLLDCAEKDLVK